MFTKDEIALLDEAVAGAVRILKRNASEKPRFAEVAERDIQAYTALTTKYRSMQGETPKAPVKG